MVPVNDGIPVSKKLAIKRVVPEASLEDIQVDLNRVKYNLRQFKKLETETGSPALECIYILSKQVHALALIVERMYHDSI